MSKTRDDSLALQHVLLKQRRTSEQIRIAEKPQRELSSLLAALMWRQHLKFKKAVGR